MQQLSLRILLVISSTVIVLGTTTNFDVLAMHTTMLQLSNSSNSTIPLSDSAEIRKQALADLSLSQLDKEKKMHQQLLQQEVPVSGNSNMSQTDIRIDNQTGNRINEQIDSQIESRITPAADDDVTPTTPSNVTDTDTTTDAASSNITDTSSTDSSSSSSSPSNNNEDESSSPSPSTSYSVSSSPPHSPHSSSNGNNDDEMNHQANEVTSSLEEVTSSLEDSNLEFGSILCDFVLVNGHLSLDNCVVLD